MTASQPLQALSPERVNGTRPLSTSTTTTKSPSKADLRPKDDAPPSPFGSPTRQQSNLFADYHPHRGSIAKESGFALAASPSFGEIHALRTTGLTSRHTRGLSATASSPVSALTADVQGLVKRFEHLDVRDRDAESTERRRKLEAELRRAQIAREEAEGDARRLREESRRVKKELEESKERERKVGKRLDVVLEEYHNYKEGQASQVAVYEKEVRKARKEAFKSSSTFVKLQEELKSTRSTLRVAQANLDSERRKIQQRDQETFNAQYKLVSVQEELEKLQVQFQIAEEERAALKRSLKEEEVARIAAEGRIALPPSSADDEDLLRSPSKRSPMKRPVSPYADEDKENNGVVTKKSLEIKSLLQDLALERTRREQAEDMAEFLRLECQFGCCSCRTTDSGKHDAAAGASDSFIEEVALIRQIADDVLAPAPSAPEVEMEEQLVPSVVSRQSKPREIEVRHTPEIEMAMDEDVPAVEEQEEVDMSCTMRADQSVLETPAREATPAPASVERDVETTLVEQPKDEPIEIATPVGNTSFSHSEQTTTTKVALAPSSPQTPPLATTPFRAPSSIRTVTTTTMIPMQFTPMKPSISSAPATTEASSSSAPTTTEEAISPTDPELSGPANNNDFALEPTFDRAAALAAIAYRRGRAKSLANGQATPRKQMLEGAVGMKDRRDVSAPLLGQAKKEAVGATAGAGRGTSGRKTPTRH